MTPEEIEEWAARRPIPWATIPGVFAAAGDPDAVSVVLAEVDNAGLARLIGCGCAPVIHRALLGEWRRRRARRAFDRLARDVVQMEATG